MKKRKQLENIRVEVIEDGTYFTSSGRRFTADIPIGQKVRLSSNLDNHTLEDGQTCYLASWEHSDPKRLCHRGITRLRAGKYKGDYVIMIEVIETGELRRNSFRRAFIVTEEEALDYIIFSGHLELLERKRFKPLKDLLYANPTHIDWRNAEPPQNIERRLNSGK